MTSRYDDLSKEDLIRTLERRDARRALGLVWERDRIAQDAAHNNDFVAFDLDAALSSPPCPDGGWKSLIIEGESLDEKALRRALHVILGQWPEITREALRKSMASCADVIDAAPLPEFWESETRLLDSPLNLYSVLPQGHNTWEQPFAEWLDRQEETILWGIRNLPRPNAAEDRSVRIVLPENGSGFYPDFVVCVDGRKSGIALAETKERVDSAETEAKTRTEHREYGRALMLAYDKPRNRFYRYEYSFESTANYETGLLRLEDLVEP